MLATVMCPSFARDIDYIIHIHAHARGDNGERERDWVVGFLLTSYLY